VRQACLACSHHCEESPASQLDGLVDLIISRGSNDLVASSSDHTPHPRAGHADGICHQYAIAGEPRSRALRIAIDQQDPSTGSLQWRPETLLVHQEVAARLPVSGRFPAFTAAGVGAARRFQAACCPGVAQGRPAQPDWSTELFEAWCWPVKVVAQPERGDWRTSPPYGSRHTE